MSSTVDKNGLLGLGRIDKDKVIDALSKQKTDGYHFMETD